VRDLCTRFAVTLAPAAVADSPRAHTATEVFEQVTVSSVASDNRVCADGDLFVALPGGHVHGARFAADAVRRGATAVLTDAAGSQAIAADATMPPGIPVLIADDPRALLGPIAAWVFGQPAEALDSFAVTGTNGKTTTVFLLDHLLRALGVTPGLVGTVLMRAGDRVLPSTLTTPEAADLQALLASMAQDNVTALSMEVSSHALALHRVDGVVFDVAGFTNLTQDHLDFHGTMEAYFEAKALLFTPDHAQRGVVCVDDRWGELMAHRALIPVTTVRTLPASLTSPPADWVVSDVEPYGTGSAFTLTFREGRSLRTHVSLPGDFNVSNAALALVMALQVFPFDRVAAAVEAAGGMDASVPGRMEVVGDSPRVVVDFAHNTEALMLALAALRATTQGRLVVVTGAAGDRDAGKRPAMGAAAAQGADIVIITDDDPHCEDPAAIRAAVLAGARDAAASNDRQVDVSEIPDRSDAIIAAITQATAYDTVLVAGRGHETIQEVAGIEHHLDDREVARQALLWRSDRAYPPPQGAQW
jgi:UDP-N-acetylmuramoyl-L-alanyl-D-glutamate--2,6-diaminopimelate ligase